MAASSGRVICFATQLSKMRLSVRGEKWIALLRGLLKPPRGRDKGGEGKKKQISRASVYIRMPREFCGRYRAVAQCRARKIVE